MMSILRWDLGVNASNPLAKLTAHRIHPIRFRECQVVGFTEIGLQVVELKVISRHILIVRVDSISKELDQFVVA